MTAEIWNRISIAGFSISGMALIVSGILFYKLKIIRVISYLSGRAVQKTIVEMQMNNRQKGRKTYWPVKSTAPDTETQQLSEVTEASATEHLPEFTEAAVTQPLPGYAEDINTTVLFSDEREEEPVTELLVQGDETFTIIKNIVLIHTDEMI